MASQFYSVQLTVLHQVNATHTMVVRPSLVLLVRGTVADDGLVEQIQRIMVEPPEWGAVGVSTGNELRWRILTLHEMRGVVAALERLGLPRRRPDLDSVPDTSDTIASTNVTGALGDHAFSFAMSQQCSGYRGRDAAAFAGLMGWLLQLAGISDEALIRMLCADRS